MYLSLGSDNGSIFGHGSPNNVLSVMAAPSANDSRQYPPSKITAIRPCANGNNGDIKCA